MIKYSTWMMASNEPPEDCHPLSHLILPPTEVSRGRIDSAYRTASLALEALRDMEQRGDRVGET